LWLCAGGILKPIFSHPTQARIIRRVFAVLMLGSVIYALR
jgi:threonine/homoserine/homoserine lactone efflux protein